jgi:predicted dehydrogenase
MTESASPRVGIVGLGNIGQYHVDRLRELGANVVGGMDIDATARSHFTETYGIAAYDDHEDLFDVAEAIIVTTPNKYHEEYATDALEAGLDVLLEKPLAHSVESAERIAATAQEADGFCMAGFNNRYANPVEAVKGHQADGRFGDVRHVEANYIRRRGIPGRGSWFTSKEVAGGGALIDIGVHAIDLALYFLDFPEIVEVSGQTRAQFGGREEYSFIEMWGEDIGPEGFDVDDSASAFIRCADGSTVSLEVAWATNRESSQDFVLRGTDAGAKFDKSTGDLTVYESSEVGTDQLTDATVETRPNDAHKSEQEAFLAAVAAGEAPERNTMEQALTVQRVIDAIYRSSERNEAVSLRSVENPDLRVE